MDPVNNNQFEIKPNEKMKRKMVIPCQTAYMNPALDILANDDPMCNNKMEIVPLKKRKRTRSCEIAAFENTALDLGISKAAVNEFLARELENVRKNFKISDTLPVKANSYNFIDKNVDITFDVAINKIDTGPHNHSEPIYANTDISREINTQISNTMAVQRVSCSNIEQSNLACKVQDVELDSGISILEPKSLPNVATDFEDGDLSRITHITNVQTNITNNIIINNHTNLSLSFIDRLALDSPNTTNRSLYLDDDLNESNIMEIKTITHATENKSSLQRSTNPFLSQSLDESDIPVGENPFLDLNPTMNHNEVTYDQCSESTEAETHYNLGATNIMPQIPQNIMPRRLFTGEANNTVSTIDETIANENLYENVDSLRSESPIYENIPEMESINKQSKILGYDVTKFSAIDIMNLNRNSQARDTCENRKEKKSGLLKASNKLSKKVFNTLKKTFKGDKADTNETLNPYEVPRKPPKKKVAEKEPGIENPALNLDNSDDIDIEELDDEHQYETIKTLRNTRLNMNVTPLREKTNDVTDTSQNKSYTPGKKVRFDSTLNREKIITGNSFDYSMQSPGFDAKLDKYQDELENCINERKFIQQNM